MNNTFCLGIFLLLVYARKLPWTFSAETISILVIQVCVSKKRILILSFNADAIGARGDICTEENASPV
jgi:hypothetical protein